MTLRRHRAMTRRNLSGTRIVLVMIALLLLQSGGPTAEEAASEPKTLRVSATSRTRFARPVPAAALSDTAAAPDVGLTVEEPSEMFGHFISSCGSPSLVAPGLPDGFEAFEFPHGIRIGVRKGLGAEERAWLYTTTVDEAMRRAAAITDTLRRATITVVVYPSMEELREDRGLPPWAGGAYDGAVWVSSDVAPEKLRRTLRHEVMHAQLHASVGCMPFWFNEGLAQYAEAEVSRVVIGYWLRQVREGWPLSFSELESGRAGTAVKATARYAQSLGMLLWLESEVGVPEAIDVLRSRTGMPELLNALIPDATPQAYVRFLRDRLGLVSSQHVCRIRTYDVDAVRCMSNAEVSAYFSEFRRLHDRP